MQQETSRNEFLPMRAFRFAVDCNESIEGWPCCGFRPFCGRCGAGPNPFHPGTVVPGHFHVLQAIKELSLFVSHWIILVRLGNQTYQRMMGSYLNWKMGFSSLGGQDALCSSNDPVNCERAVSGSLCATIYRALRA